ncbi:T9SS type A sorting domain-containing protein [Aequorivita sp. H23M31]|uniref:T9SS type A sorting domain-containing protein n=1 Tax=Aequorivita ciconiae TaxID=2494375 RepID=A0A410G7F2_9FLAO|nr:T9SS type A sorting domain-containing protein [Aequorivita sp. H23M31]QAA83115.1 T9SS type A sorting domain-containing protein [Aequorivita sp. H23M31]
MNNRYSFIPAAEQKIMVKGLFLALLMIFPALVFAQTLDPNGPYKNVSKPVENDLLGPKTDSGEFREDQILQKDQISRIPYSVEGSHSIAEIWENFNSSVSEICSRGSENLSFEDLYDVNNYAFADDFEVESNEKFVVEQLRFTFLMDNIRDVNQLIIKFYKDNSGNGPGEEITFSLAGTHSDYTRVGTYDSQKDIFIGTITFGTPVEFPGGVNGRRYWGALEMSDDGPTNSIVFIGTEIGPTQTFYVNRTGFWEKNTTAYSGVFPQDLILSFIGDCDPGYVYYNNNWSPQDPDGVSLPTDNFTVLNGTAVLNSATDVHNIIIRPGAKLEVKDVLNLYGDIKIEGDLIFVSSATGDGQLGHVASTSNIIGDATVQRYFLDKRTYRMVTSAVTTTTTIRDNWQEGVNNTGTSFPGDNLNPNPGYGTHITGSLTGQNGFDATLTGNPSMYTVDTEQQSFVIVPNTNISKLVAGFPYLLMVRGDRSINLTNNFSHGSTVLRAKGKLFKGNMLQEFPTQELGNFAMFGNPYQCAVDVNELFANATNVNINFYYVFDPLLGPNGGYSTIQLPDGSSIVNSEANQFLQPGQGGQFATIAPGPSQLTFEEDDKAPGEFTASSATGNDDQDKLVVKLFNAENLNNGGGMHDGLGIMFGPDNSNEINSFDARKPFNFYENLGINNNGVILSIEKRAMPEIEEVFHLYSSGYSENDYALKVEITGLDDFSFYLEDAFTGSSTLLSDGETNYSFSVNSNYPESKASDRFSIRTAERLGVDSNNLLSGISLYPNPWRAGNVYLNAPQLNGQQVEVTITDLTGRMIYDQVLGCDNSTITLPINSGLNTGVYLVTLKFEGQENTFRLIKQ